jgi:hypothetical protein
MEVHMKRICCILVVLVMAKESLIMANASKPVPFSLVSAPRLWAIDDKTEYTVVTGKNWSKYYSSKPEDADFAASLYVVASMGTRPNPGYRIRILQISQEGERVQVTVEQLNPDPKGIYPQVLVNPIAVAEVKRKDLQPYPALVFAFVTQSGQPFAEVTVEL